MKCIGTTLLISAYVVSGCASPQSSLENAIAVESPPQLQQMNAGISSDVALPVSKTPPLLSEAKPLRPNLLGATYIKPSSLPKVVANNWKVVTSLALGKEGDTDVFVIEKKSRKRLVLASSEKRVLRNFYRYSIKSELELPTSEANTVLAQCTSTGLSTD